MNNKSINQKAQLFYALLKKIPIAMRMTLLLLFVLTFQLQAEHIYSQDAKISLNMRNSTVEKVLQTIEEKSDYYFLYNNRLIDVDRKVSVQVRNAAISAVLERLFNSENVDYEVKGSQIILSPKEMHSQITAVIEAIQQQKKTVTGKIIDAAGIPIIGANIVETGTTNGTVTDIDGNFALQVEDNAEIQISYIGYLEQNITTAGRTTFNITLQEDTQALEELIVIGYGTQQKGRLTGAVSNISGNEISNAPTTNLQQTLQGKIPGLKINDRGGEPGKEGMEMLIRGKSTLGNNSPLIVIDGIPRSGFSDINPQDVESISVLKDAAAAIYGARAANGVILVTTRRGKTGDSKISLTADYGLSSFIRLPKLMNSYQYTTYLNEIDLRYGATPVWTEEDLQKFKSGNYPLTHPSTDYYKETYNDYAPQNRYTISANGGSEQLKYFISGEYLHKGSMYKEGDMFYNRYQIRSNLDSKVTEYLNIGVDLSGSLRNAHSPSYSPLYEIPQAKPYTVERYPNGLPGDALAGINFRTLTSDKGGWNDDNTKEFRSKLSFNLDMGKITQGLNLSGYAAFDYGVTNYEYFANTYKVYTYNETTDEYIESLGLWKYRELNQSVNSIRDHLYHIRLEYKNSFNDHNINSFIAYEQSDGFLRYLEGYRRDLVSGEKVDLWAGSSLGQTNTGYSDEWGRVNYFGYFSYDYKRKYLLDLTLRHDGSFNFPSEGRFGTFPSASLGWVISEESFFNSNKIDFLKLRLSLAQLGNDLIPSFQYLTKYNIPTSYSGWYVFGESPERADGLVQSNVPNPNITWEVATTWNAGLDINLFEQRLTGSFDYFYSKRRDILITRAASIPDYTALALPQENLGKVDNSGFEFQLNYENKWREINYNIGGNFQYNKNKVVYIDEAKDIPDYRRAEGKPLDSYVVYKTEGIFNSQEEIDNTKAVIAGTRPGDVKYVDLNGDGQITGADQYRTDFGRTPRVQWGINLGFDYHGFGVSMLFHGQHGAQNMIRYESGATKTNLPEYFFTQRWTPENPNAKYPSAYRGSDTYTSRFSDFWLYDGSFISLQNLNISYDLPSQWVSALKLSNIQVYFQGNRLWYIWDGISARTKTKDYNPEMGDGPGSYNPEQYYPQQRLYNFGMNITF